MNKNGFAVLAFLIGSLCGVFAESAEYDGLTIKNSDKQDMVILNDNGGVLGVSLELKKKGINIANNPYFRIEYADAIPGWKIGSYTHDFSIPTKPEICANLQIFADTLNVEANLLTAGSMNVDLAYVNNFTNRVRIISPEEGAPTTQCVLGSEKTENGNGWILNTQYGVPGGLSDSPLSFYATNYHFKRGSMVVDGTLTCKDKMKVVEVETGKLKANDVTVDMNNAADYVFDENYDLKSLGEVEAYVKANKHLPGIPSASQMKEEGMNVSEMSNLLLEKIEELTLHVIRLEKENQELKSEMKAMKSGK